MNIIPAVRKWDDGKKKTGLISRPVLSSGTYGEAR
jgi:hypothetical protein